MLRNYLTIAFRNLFRHRNYTLLNVWGLAIGMACALLIFIFVRFESSFDTFHQKKDRLYRVVTEERYKEGTDYSTGVPFPLPDAMRTDFPQVKAAKLFHSSDGQITVLNERKNNTQQMFKEEVGIFYMEPAFFELFDFPFLVGNAKTSLSAPNQVVLTQASAQKYFGNWKTAVGRFVKFEGKTLQVSGILQNPPINTDFPLKVLVSYRTFRPFMGSWDGITSEFQCYLTLPEGLSEGRFNHMLAAFQKKHMPDQRINHQLLQPLSDIHFSQQYDSFAVNNISRQALWLLFFIGVFLVIMACVNFVNLATAQAVKRSKEMGVRKVLGGNRSQLFGQLMGETFLIVLSATILSVLLTELALPTMKQFSGLPDNLALFSSEIGLFLLATLLLITLLAGFYPALVISGFQPVLALKNSISTRTVGGISLRRVLVVLQFTISQVLMVGTMVVVSQMDFVRSMNLGFNQEAIVFFRVPGDSLSKTRREAFKNELLQHANIKQASYSWALPSDNDYNWNRDFQFDNQTKTSGVETQMKFADTAYFNVYGLQLLAGRKYQPSDTMRELVVNETFLRKVGGITPQEAIGKTISFSDLPSLPIVGVVKDFHNASLRSDISAIAMSTNANVYYTLSIQVAPKDISKMLAFVEKRWQKTFPENVFEYNFLDEKIARYYQQEEKMMQLFKTFAGVAIFISCLGLYGLASFMAVQRTKEIGIRKVLGASVSHIVYLFSKEFTGLVGLAFLVATPVAYYLATKLLENFAYRIPIGVGMFLAGIIASLTIALLTVSFQAIKAAVANPVKSLRTE